MGTNVPLDADAPVLPLWPLVLYVDDARIRLRLLHEELGAALGVCLDDDQLLVRPSLCVEAPPELLVEAVPGLRRRCDNRDAALLPDGRGSACGAGRATLVGRRLDLLPELARSPARVEDTICPEPERALMVVPIKRLGRELRDLLAIENRASLLLPGLQDLANLDHDMVGVVAAAAAAAELPRRVQAPTEGHIARARACLAVHARHVHGVQVA
mmetsp:Transcript_42529/g.109809  ORF Transcript_42529/g.109809 Transcript_42529/m.109809 type:complete len:214 (-) Transcript_42529:73-714(-)